MIELLDPTTEAATQTIAYTPRPTALAGKRVALVENTKYNSDRILERVGELLKTEYGVVETKMFRKRNASVPAHQEIIEEVRKNFDVMVAGVGD